MYDQILALNEVKDKQRKGYLFEQIIREILPWSFRPPIAVLSDSEQLDAFFEWNSWHFLVEAKAKEKKITAGSHDWEDFELKIRKRKGFCIGLYLSLGPVASEVINNAKALNNQGLCTIILHDKIWHELYDSYIPFEDLLRYMVFRTRSCFEPCPETLQKVKEWCYDRNTIDNQLYTLCRSFSSTFLRRQKHPKHIDFYVTRAIDEYTSAAASELVPNRLMRRKKHKKIKHRKILTSRETPKQIILIRDTSGCGKTTYSVQMGLTREYFLGISKAAIEDNIDNFSEFLLKIGRDFGLNKLITIDKPLVFVIDSLDEASKVPNKKKEIIGLLKLIDELNTIASKYNIIAYPLLLVFTIRDDYWREWESVFEGCGAKTFRNRFSHFTTSELETAIEKYSKLFNYSITNKLSLETKRVLSVPFNIQIFSEAYEYDGSIIVDEVFEEDVLHLYFSRKRDEIIKRRIPTFMPKEFMCTCAKLAMTCVSKRENMLTRQELLQAILESNPKVQMDANEISLAIRSEQIIVEDPENANIYRFRHSRFLEYLSAHYIVLDALHYNSAKNLEYLTNQIFESGFLSMFRVHDYIRFICNKEFPKLQQLFENFYSKSTKYMKSNVRRLRSHIAAGASTGKENIKLIIKHTESSNPEVVWDSFFIITAKKNNQSVERIIVFFVLAWKTNSGRSDRWKLLDKLAQHNLLLNDKVFTLVMDSGSAKEWQVFLGFILEEKRVEGFVTLWESICDKAIKSKITKQTDLEWLIVKKLLSIILNREEYIPGELIDRKKLELSKIF